MRPPRFALVCLILLASLLGVGARAAEKKLVLVAGRPSHGPGDHEFNAGVQLLQKCLASVPNLRTEVVLNAGPISDETFRTADAIIVYSDGEFEDRHPALRPENFARFAAFATRGGGIGFIHYAVEPNVPKGGAEFLRWIGGEFQVDRSVNPIWEANFTTLPAHPITRGVRPFAIRDEWYFNLRFADDAHAITPLLVAIPPPETMDRKDGKHEGNPDVRARVDRREPQTVAWAYERPGGGRGFGFTGAHFHRNWGDENFRRLVLNAAVWLAQLEVPAAGVSSSLTPEDLAANLDPKPRKK